MSGHRAIPIIDLFAGPGGLGEGFASFNDGGASFKVALSIEMEFWAHQTLSLRSFFHQFPRRGVPNDYYAYLRGEITRVELFARHPEEASASSRKAWHAELGVVDSTDVDVGIRNAINQNEPWVLCGGPPCQAFSVVGRSRTGGISELDSRVYLYRQYLRILAGHEPPVFVIENVKGLLSSQVKGKKIFRQMLDDLRHPGGVGGVTRKSGARYTLYSLVSKDGENANTPEEPSDFVVRCEEYGIPQSRHRIIILGVREDIDKHAPPALQPHGTLIATRSVLNGLPRLRSGLTHSEDSREAWHKALQGIRDSSFMRSRRNGSEQLLRERVVSVLNNEQAFRADRGREFISCEPRVDFNPAWFLDPALGGITNHVSRPHMATDLHRYLFVAAYARVQRRSPELKDFPEDLYPDHRNINDALRKGHFDDRFRVQICDKPSTTITSHIAKDGHYFIHYDEAQCRSLTVREAARLQTFPDNYHFCGPRTHQYRQVGNAVPPLLAGQIARIVRKTLTAPAASPRQEAAHG